MGGEGSGKSFQAGLFGAVCAAYDTQFDAKLYWIVAADFEDAKKDAEYVRDFLEKLGNLDGKPIFPDRADQRCVIKTKTGQTFVTVSAYDETKLGREEPDGIIGAEVSRWTQEAFERCEGRLLRKYPRAWGFFTGSFETSLGWLPDLWKYTQGPNEREIRSYSIPAWANLHLYPGGRDDPAIKAAEAGRSPQKFLERFGAHPAPAANVIFNEFRTHLHVDMINYLPDLPVYLAIDPGDRVYAVLFVQLLPNGEVWVQDEVYESHWTHQQVITAAKMKDGWPLVRGGAIDVASKQAHMGMPIPLEEWYKDTGLALWAQKQSVEDSIERVRLALSINPNTGRPRLRMHPRCRGLISEMGGGPSPVADGGPWMRYLSKMGMGPPMEKNDHACKALAYLLGGPYGFAAVDRSYEAASYLTKSSNKRYEGAASYFRGRR